jgi:RNA polymerase sigma factor (sigma-70 family)
MSDKEIIGRILGHDAEITKDFFYVRCRPLFLSVIRSMFDYPIEYDEFVNEVYTLLMENDGARLRQFKGDSSIFQWLKVIVIRHFLKQKSMMIDGTSKETPYYYNQEKYERCGELEREEARWDLEQLLEGMQNKRYSFVLKRLILDGADNDVVAKEMNVKVENLYNIKKRAIDALVDIALSDKRIYNSIR